MELPKDNMTNEQKLKIVKRALEMGEAHIRISFHDVREEENAIKTIEELAEMADAKVYNDGFKSRSWFYFSKSGVNVSSFYDDEEIPRVETWMEGTQ